MNHCDPVHLAEVEQTARSIVSEYRSTFPVAADWLDHYLSGKGGTRNANLHWLRRSTRFRAAEEALQKQIELELVRAILAMLMTGQSHGTQVTQVGGKSVIVELVSAEFGTDLFFASNNSSISAKLQFNLVPRQGLPWIGGQAEFVWKDVYDWNPKSGLAGLPIPKPVLPLGSQKNSIDYRDLDALQSCQGGPAAEFDAEAKWTGRVQPKQGMTNLIKWIAQQPRSRFEIDSRIKADIAMRALFQWTV